MMWLSSPPTNPKAAQILQIRIIPLIVILLLRAPTGYGQVTDEFNNPQEALVYLEALSNRFDAANAELRAQFEFPPDYDSMSQDQQNEITSEAYSRRARLTGDMDKSVSQADQIVPTMVAQMLTAGTLGEAMAGYPSNEAFQWIEGTSALSSEKFEQIRLDAMSSKAFFSVVYQEFDLEDGRVLYVFGQYRLTGVPREQTGIFDVAHASSFVIQKTPDEVVLHRIAMENGLSFHPYGTFAGFIPDSHGNWPSLVFIRGPEGSGEYLRIFHADIDETTDMLRINRYDEYYAPVSTYAFDPKSGSIDLDFSHKYGAGGGKHTVDSSELVGEGHPLPSTKGEHFAIGSGKRIDTAMVQPGEDDSEQPAKSGATSTKEKRTVPQENENTIPKRLSQPSEKEATSANTPQAREGRSNMLTYGTILAIVVAFAAILLLFRIRRSP